MLLIIISGGNIKKTQVSARNILVITCRLQWKNCLAKRVIKLYQLLKDSALTSDIEDENADQSKMALTPQRGRTLVDYQIGIHNLR